MALVGKTDETGGGRQLVVSLVLPGGDVGDLAVWRRVLGAVVSNDGYVR